MSKLAFNSVFGIQCAESRANARPQVKVWKPDSEAIPETHPIQGMESLSVQRRK